jgi:hypothetical protein
MVSDPLHHHIIGVKKLIVLLNVLSFGRHHFFRMPDVLVLFHLDGSFAKGLIQRLASGL